MKLKVKDMDIATGSTLVAILNEMDAEKLDLHALDRVNIKKGSIKTIAIIDLAESEKAVPRGKIGLFEEVLSILKAKNNDTVSISLARKPKSSEYILKKLNGFNLSKQEIEEIVKDIINNSLSEVELTYYISACYVKGMSMKETTYLTKAMVDFGDKLKLKKRVVLDKHCSGGVPGNRTTMIIVPIIAAAGFTMPKTSSRSISSAAGTADTMEVLAPVDLSIKQIKKVVNGAGACIVWGGAIGLASADDEMIRVRHPLGLDPEGMLLSSILAKKAAVNATHVLIDIPLGKDTKIKTKKQAEKLKKSFSVLGKKLKMRIKVIVTRGEEPIGNGIGPALEARDVLWVLKRDKRRPLDLEKKSLYMASLLLEMAGVKNAKKKAYEILDSGFAYEKMKEIIKAQGGRPKIDPDKIKVGKFNYVHKANRSGRIKSLNNFAIAKIARVAGAPKDPESGIYLCKHEREKVKKGEKIFTIYANSRASLKYAKEILRDFDGIVIK